MHNAAVSEWKDKGDTSDRTGSVDWLRLEHHLPGFIETVGWRTFVEALGPDSRKLLTKLRFGTTSSIRGMVCRSQGRIESFDSFIFLASTLNEPQPCKKHILAMVVERTEAMAYSAAVCDKHPGLPSEGFGAEQRLCRDFRDSRGPGGMCPRVASCFTSLAHVEIKP